MEELAADQLTGPGPRQVYLLCSATVATSIFSHTESCQLQWQFGPTPAAGGPIEESKWVLLRAKALQSVIWLLVQALLLEMADAFGSRQWHSAHSLLVVSSTCRLF